MLVLPFRLFRCWCSMLRMRKRGAGTSLPRDLDKGIVGYTLTRTQGEQRKLAASIGFEQQREIVVALAWYAHAHIFCIANGDDEDASFWNYAHDKVESKQHNGCAA